MSQKQEPPLHRPTTRILELLETVSEHPAACTLSDLSSMLQIPKSTLSPILSTLVRRDYLSMDAAQRYTLGLSSYRLGHSFKDQFHFPTEAEHILVSLTESCQETSHFCLLTGGDVLYLKKINSPQPIRMVSSVGTTLPAYSTAVGKALLLDFSLEQLKELYPEGLSPVTEKTIPDIEVLYRELERGRKEGYTYEREESNEFIQCIACPIRQNGRIIAAVSVAIPTFRYTEEKAEEIRRDLDSAKRKFELMLSSLDVNLNELL